LSPRKRTVKKSSGIIREERILEGFFVKNRSEQGKGEKGRVGILDQPMHKEKNSAGKAPAAFSR